MYRPVPSLSGPLFPLLAIVHPRGVVKITIKGHQGGAACARKDILPSWGDPGSQRQDPCHQSSRAGWAPTRHTPVTVKLSSDQAPGALAEGKYTQCPKPVPASQRGREAIARGLSDFILEQQGPETKATWGMCLRGVWSTPHARMWSEGLFVQQWEHG